MKFFEYNCFKPSQHSFSETKNQSGVWCPLFGEEPQPTQRSNHAICVHNNQIFMYGGRGVKGTLNQFWVFNYGTSKWKEVSPTGDAPPPLEGHSMVVYEEKIYIFGGETSFATADELPLWSFDIKECKWSKIGTNGKVMAPCGRRHHTAVLYMDAMCIYGGYQDLMGPTREMWLFDFETISWHFDIAASCETGPDARYGHSATVKSQSMLICGGLTGLKPNSDVFIWNFELMVWIPVKTKGGPSQLSGHSMCMVGSLMYVFGGRNASGESSNDMWSLSLSDNSWKKRYSDATIKPPAISGHCLINFSAPNSRNKQEFRTRSLPNIKKKERMSHKNTQPTKLRSVSCGKLPNNSQKVDRHESDCEIMHSDRNALVITDHRRNEYAYDNPASELTETESAPSATQNTFDAKAPVVSAGNEQPSKRIYFQEKSARPKNKTYVSSRIKYGNLQPKANNLNTFSYNLIRDSMHECESVNTNETSFIDISSNECADTVLPLKSGQDMIINNNANHVRTTFPDITSVLPCHYANNTAVLEMEFMSLDGEQGIDIFEYENDASLQPALLDNSDDKNAIKTSESDYTNVAQCFQSQSDINDHTILLVLGGRIANVNPNSKNPFCMWQCKV